jgi:hypothetical protein
MVVAQGTASRTIVEMEGLGSRVRPRIHRRFADIADVITPVTPRLRITPQSDDILEAAHTRFGEIGERLYASIYGGLVASDIFPDVDPRKLPDVIDIERKTFAEVKWCCIDSQVQLRDSQVAYWRELQATFPDWTVEFFVPRHGIDNIKTYGKTERALHEDIANRPIYGVRVTLDLMLKLHSYHLREQKTGQQHKYVRSYEEKDEAEHGIHTYETCACIKTGGMHAMIEDTRKIFPKEEASVAWLGEMRLNRHTITPFPIADIRSRNYDAWRERHARTYRPPEREGELSETPVEVLAGLLGEKYGIAPPARFSRAQRNGHSNGTWRIADEDPPF